jgi:hypothetical protein
MACQNKSLREIEKLDNELHGITSLEHPIRL